MTRGKIPRPPAAAFDRLGEEQEALEAVAVLWRVLAAMPDDARALLLAYLARKQSPGQIASLVLADPRVVSDVLDYQHDFLTQRFRIMYGLVTQRRIITTPPPLPKVFPQLYAAFLEYLAQASHPAEWISYVADLLDRELLNPFAPLPDPPPDFALADPQRLPLSPADPSDAPLARGDRSEVPLRAVDLAGANLAHASLRDVDLREANLAGADLTGADVGGSDLTYANLTGANLQETNLSYVDLIRANLSSANLLGADLFAANLTEADLTGANLTRALWSMSDWIYPGTVWPSPAWAERMHAVSEEIGGRVWRCG